MSFVFNHSICRAPLGAVIYRLFFRIRRANLAGLALAFVVCLGLPPVCLLAQDFPVPRPGPEHEKLKQREGTWDVTSESPDMAFRGTMVWRMDLGGLWLASQFEGEAEGVKFSGRGFDTFDPVSKKYVNIWVDSMSTRPGVFQGDFDAAGKVLTMEGEGPGFDGKPTRYRMVTEQLDANTLISTMSILGPDGTATQIFRMKYQRRIGQTGGR